MSAAGTGMDAADLRIEGGVRLTHAGRWKKLAWLAVGLFAALTVLGPMLSGLLTVASLAAAALSASLLARLHFRHGFATTRGMVPGAVSISGGAVSVELRGLRRTFAPAEIEDGWFEPGVLSTAVLRLKNGDLLAFSTPDEAGARAALRAAGVSPSQQVLRVRIASAASQRPGGRVVGVLALAVVCGAGIPAALVLAGEWLSGIAGALAGLAPSAPLLFFVGFALYKTVQFLWPPTAVIGCDGVLVRGIGRRRFVPYAQVTDVTREPHAVWLRLRSGEDVLLPTLPMTPVAEIVHDRIRDAMRAARAAASPEAKLALLDRNGRSFEAWKAALGELVQSAGYRTVVLDHEELGDVIEDAGATPERRVAAAMALAAAGRPEAETRARIAAQTCADERLRIAVDLASRGELDEAGLSRALEGARGASAEL